MLAKIAHRLRLLRDSLYTRPYAVLLALGALSLLIFLAAIPLPRVDGQLVGSDGTSYYMYVRSFWIDGDLDFHNEYQHLRGQEGYRIPETGMRHNQYGIGCAVLWTPFFLLAHGVAALLNAVGIATPMDGYSYLYQAFTLTGSILYGVAGVLLSYRLAAKLYTRSSALLATVTFWLASNLLYYLIAEPSMSHANALFVVALFVTYWHRTRGHRNTGQWALLGLLGAVILMLRFPDGPYLVIPAVESAGTLIEILRQRDGKRLGQHLLNNAAFLAATFVGFLPQMFAWRTIYGKFFALGYRRVIENRGFSWFAPKIFKVLFSSWHGLISWHPIYLFALIGLLYYLWRKDKVMALALSLAFLLNLYVISAWNVWWLGAAFGGRAFVNGAALFVVGLTALIDALKSRKDTLWIEAVALALVAWNALFMVQYRFGFVSLEDPLTFREMVWDKFTLPLRLIQRFLK